MTKKNAYYSLAGMFFENNCIKILLLVEVAASDIGIDEKKSCLKYIYLS